MAKLMLIGRVADVELTRDDEDGRVVARCNVHDTDIGFTPLCTWTERYDDMNDATEYAADHADRGTR